MKISHSLKQDVSSEWNSPQTVNIKNKTNERKQCQKQNIFNNKIERSDWKANTNISGKIKISHNLKKDTSILQQKWKYLIIWNKILVQKRIVHKQLKWETK